MNQEGNYKITTRVGDQTPRRLGQTQEVAIPLPHPAITPIKNSVERMSWSLSCHCHVCGSSHRYSWVAKNKRKEALSIWNTVLQIDGTPERQSPGSLHISGRLRTTWRLSMRICNSPSIALPAGLVTLFERNTSTCNCINPFDQFPHILTTPTRKVPCHLTKL